MRFPPNMRYCTATFIRASCCSWRTKPILGGDRVMGGPCVGNNDKSSIEAKVRISLFAFSASHCALIWACVRPMSRTAYCVPRLFYGLLTLASEMDTREATTVVLIGFTCPAITVATVILRALDRVRPPIILSMFTRRWELA